MDWLLFIHKILFSSTCFEHQVLIFRRIQLYTCSIWYCHSLWEFLVASRYTTWVRTDWRGKVVGGCLKTPCDFDLIPKMKQPLRGIRFRTVPEILQAVDHSIRTINTTGAAKGILRLPHRWERVVHNAGDYIEGQWNFETCIYFVSVVNN